MLAIQITAQKHYCTETYYVGIKDAFDNLETKMPFPKYIVVYLSN